MNLEGVLACCAVCNQQTHRRCGRCLNIYYCNTEHQRQDWRRHKSDCAPKLQKQGQLKDKVGDHSTTIAENSKSDKEKELNNKSTENSKDLKKEIETKESKKSKRKNVKKEGRVVSSVINTSQTENVAQSTLRLSTAEQTKLDQTLKEKSVISSVVYTNKDLTKESAIVHEGSSEQEILSESAQQLSTLDFTTASTSNVLKTVNKSDNKMLAIPGYNTEQNMRNREYPEATLKGSTAPFNNVLNSYYLDPADPSYDLCQRVIQDMTQYGVCVLNNFLGKERGIQVLNEVLDMYRSGIFTDSMSELRELCYPGTDVLMLCFSVVRPETFRSVAERWTRAVAGVNAPLVLVGTQSDLALDGRVLQTLRSRGEHPVTDTEARALAAKINATYVETSAKTRKQLKDAFDAAILAGLPVIHTKRPFWKKLLCLN